MPVGAFVKKIFSAHIEAKKRFHGLPYSQIFQAGNSPGTCQAEIFRQSNPAKKTTIVFQKTFEARWMIF